MTTPATSRPPRPPLVSDEVWALYLDLMESARTVEIDRELLRQIYSVAPELEGLAR